MSWEDILKKEYMFRDVREFVRYMIINNIQNANYVSIKVNEIMRAGGLPKEQQYEKLKELTNAITREDDLRMAWIQLLEKGRGFRNGAYGDLE